MAKKEREHSAFTLRVQRKAGDGVKEYNARFICICLLLESKLYRKEYLDRMCQKKAEN